MHILLNTLRSNYQLNKCKIWVYNLWYFDRTENWLF